MRLREISEFNQDRKLKKYEKCISKHNHRSNTDEVSISNFEKKKTKLNTFNVKTQNCHRLFNLQIKK